MICPKCKRKLALDEAAALAVIMKQLHCTSLDCMMFCPCGEGMQGRIEIGKTARITFDNGKTFFKL